MRFPGPGLHLGGAGPYAGPVSTLGEPGTLGTSTLGTAAGRAAPARRRAAVVAANEILARRLLAAAAQAGVEVSATAQAASALEPRGAVPDVLVLAPGADLEGAAEWARRRSPRPALLVVAADDGGRGVREALSAGADAVVLESELDETLGPALAAAGASHLVLPRSVRETLAKPVLSTRERQIAGMVVLGLTNAEIAAKLHVAETTVKSHLTSIFRKLGVRSRSEASARILDPRDGLGVSVLAIAPEQGLDVVDVP